MIQQKKIRCVWGPPLDSENKVPFSIPIPIPHPGPLSCHPSFSLENRAVVDIQSTMMDPTETPIKQQNGVTMVQTPLVQPPPQPQQFSTPSTLPPLVPTSPVATNVQPQQQQHPSSTSLESQLIEAKAQIAALTKQLEVKGSGLRQRTGATTGATTGAGGNNAAAGTTVPTSVVTRPDSAREVLAHATEQGVPVKIVAYLCFAAFLLAYLFF